MTDSTASSERDATASPSLTRESAGNTQAGAVLRMLTLICAIAVLWLVTRRYFGVIQDARFYTLEALRDLDPARFANDLYFQFGSQGSFSLFDTLYRPFVVHLGVGAAGMGAAIAGQLLWLAGLFCLVRSLVGDRYLWLSAAVVIAMPNIYAPYFSYGEALATPRLFAEAFTMLALAVLRSRPLWTFVLLGLAAALHPLMTLPGLAAAFVYLALGRPLLWVMVPVGAVLAAVLGWMDIQPFTNLYRTLDADWFAVVKVRSLQCLLTQWPSDSYLQVVNGLVWAVIGLVTLDARERRFLAAVFAAGAGGLVCTLIGADMGHNVLAAELQPWRAMWLLLVVSRIYIPRIFVSLLAKRIPNAFPIAALLSIALVLVSSGTRLVRIPHSAEFGFLSAVLVAVALAAIFSQLAWTDRRRLRQALSCLVIAVTPVALWNWDGRRPWTRFVESPEPPPPDLAALLSETSSIYWENSPDIVWLRLRRASYFSCDQGTGVVFHRETAIAYKRRVESFWPLRTADFTQSAACAAFDKTPKPQRTRQGLQQLCRREPGLDELVLTAPIRDVEPRVWKSPVLFQDIHVSDGIYSATATDRFYIYSCADVRRDAAHTGQAAIRRG